MLVIDDLNNLVEIFNYVKANWYWILLGLIVGITLITMLIRWMVESAIKIVLELILMIIKAPFILLFRKPLLFILLVGLFLGLVYLI